MRTTPGMQEFMIRLELLPALLNSEIAESQLEASQTITLPLVTIMITQGNTLPNKTEVNEIKRKIANEQEVRISEQDLKVEQDHTPHTLKATQDAKMLEEF